MTINQTTVHPSTVSIPAPLYKLGQQVRWYGGDDDDNCSCDSFIGIITELNYRIDCDVSTWQYTMAITVAKRCLENVNFYVGEYSFDVDERFLTVCTKYES